MDDLIQNILSLFEEKGSDLIALYGFGSSFTGESNRQSDLDIAFLTKNRLSHGQRFEIQEALARRLKKDIDLVDLSQSSLVMKMQVISRGVRLYEAGAADCDRFETYIYSAYCRFNEERKGIIEDISKRGSVY